MRRPPPLYAIADGEALGRLGIGLAEGARRMAEAGARWVQLRGKRLSSRDLFDAACEAVRALRPLGVAVIVNDRADVALCAGADGVHLGQDDLSPVDARRILGPDALIGLSTHTLRQALRARAFPLDYVAVGPLFATSTKVAPDPVVPVEALAALRGALALPLVGIGGITRERAALVLARGCDSVAIVSDLLREGDPGAGVRAVLAALGRAAG